MSSIDDLVAWLTACLDHLERTAQAASPGPWFTPGPDTIGEWTVYSEALGWEIGNTTHYPPARAHNYWPKLRVPVHQIDANANAAHMAAHDPHAVLARVAAVREVVETWRQARNWREDKQFREGPESNSAMLAAAIQAALETVIEHLARGHRHDHPGYDPTWAPEGSTP